tara:strand:- start:289 stop:864 length:576 start_codon:yes stop_codon:yes gene_type:complete
MAIKTMPVSSGTGQFNVGWHDLTISKAEYGSWKTPDGKDKRYVDLWFDGYSDNMNLRMYEVVNKETGEEFKIANLFRYANAGIIETLNDPTGKKPIIQYDDDAANLVGKRIHTYFYKEQKTGNEYSRIFDTVAPVEQEGEHISWTADQVASLKASAEKNFNRLHDDTHTTSDTLKGTPVTHKTSNLEDVPF